MTAIGVEEQLEFPAEDFDLSRFGARWRLIGFGLFDVWKYTMLDLQAPSGRLLLRGPNGTGKTTAMEALWPYLLDLDRNKMRAGNSRTTGLTALMQEGKRGNKRIGYVWMVLEGPAEEGVHSYGVRLVLSGQKVTPEPFTIPGRPVVDMPLVGADGSSPITTSLAFEEQVKAAGGHLLDGDQGYRNELAAQVFGTNGDKLKTIANLIRQVRNPAILQAIRPEQAANELRAALPGVPEDEISATAEALAATEETREELRQAREAATHLAGLAETWTRYVAGVTRKVATQARQARTDLNEAKARSTDAQKADARAAADLAEAQAEYEATQEKATRAEANIQEWTAKDEYQSAKELEQLAATVQAQQASAEQARESLRSAVVGAARRAQELSQEATELQDDAADVVARATVADPKAGQVAAQVTMTMRPHAMLKVGDEDLNQGTLPEIATAPAALDGAAAHWLDLAGAHQERSDAAAAMGREYQTVAKEERKAADAARAASDAAEVADGLEHTLRSKQEHANRAADRAATEIIDWATRNTDLTTTAQDDALDRETVLEVRQQSPRELFTTASGWRTETHMSAERIAATAIEQARQLDSQAHDVRGEAEGHRQRAEALRSGEQLRAPRPDWVATSQTLFADALTWREGTMPGTRARIEAAMAASGILGAALTHAGLDTDDWQICVDGPTVDDSLSSILTTDPDHPDHVLAAAVLDRITLTGSATTPTDAPAVVGTDSTFRIGPILGRAPQDTVGQDSKYIGAAQKRAAALAEAERLDEVAAGLEQHAADLENEAQEEREAATQVRARAATFPDLSTLATAEHERATQETAATDARDRANQRQAVADDRAREARAAQRKWSDKCIQLSLPTKLDDLASLERTEADRARELRESRLILAKLVARLTWLHERLTRAHQDRDKLPRLQAKAQRLHLEAVAVTTRYESRTAEHGPDIADLVKQVEEETTKLTGLKDTLDTLGRDLSVKQQDKGRAEGIAEGARNDVVRLEPDADAALSVLVSLVAVAEVRAAVLPAGSEPVTGEALIGQVLDALENAATTPLPNFYKEFDRVAGEVRGRWTLDSAVAFNHEDASLFTYRCAHDGGLMEPLQAASVATELAETAHQLLNDKEDEALRDFILDRLPRAIGTAWHRMTDWIDMVNKKMNTVSASSGVGVRIKYQLRDDLSPVQRTIYALACQKSAASRTTEESEQLAQAIRTLLDATDGDMTERVTTAVDLGQWLYIEYHVRRGSDEKMKPWRSRGTGLSTGEARLATLAPMLAAVGATYDDLPETAMRLVALDEVPGEVDEQGREGLARYIASLDLDLVCTSHSWDGAPGAWDGTDIYDLAPLPGDTVAEIWMPVRATNINYPHDLDEIRNAW